MMVKVLFVCLGNICRSPLGEGVFSKIVSERGLSSVFKIDSCGTSAYHIGELPDKRMRDVAYSHGVLLTSKSRAYKKEDAHYFDYIIAMDESNYSFLLAKCEKKYHSKIFLMREFDVSSSDDKNVPDPYYGGLDAFEEVYQIVSRSCVELFNEIKNEKNI